MVDESLTDEVIAGQTPEAHAMIRSLLAVIRTRPIAVVMRDGIAEGKFTPDMREAIKKADKLRAGLPQIHREHRELVAGLKRLDEAAREVGKTDYVRFAERLSLHIQEEEEVLYPALLLVGDSVKWRLDKQ